MYLTQTNKLKHLQKDDYEIITSLSHLCKNMFNVGLYEVKEHFKNDGKYLNYFGNYHQCKSNDNFKLLGQIGTNTLRCVDFSVRSFFSLLRKTKEGIYLGKPKMPHFLSKDGLFEIIWPCTMFKVVDDKIRLSLSKEFKKKFNIKKRFLFFDLPKNIDCKTIKEVRVNPHQKGKYFTISYIYKKEEIKNENLNPEKYLSIDFGISNLASVIDSEGTSFILDGKKLKSINQGFNKEIARLQSILDHQKSKSKRYSKRMYKITDKRNNRVKEYLNLVTNHIVKYCISNDIGNVIIGDFKDIQRNSNMGKVNNQNFVQIPFGQLKMKLRNKLLFHGINSINQEESYTSKCSFLDNEDICKHDEYKGKRIKRGLFQTEKGILVNSDINGACNIMKKYLSKQKREEYFFLQLSRGLVNSPLRIRVLN